jgi:hypothetical protein
LTDGLSADTQTNRSLFHSWIRRRTVNERGVLHVPLGLLATLMVLTGLGVWGLLHHWKHLTQTQLRLDRCTGETALDLRSKLQGIASANRQMKELRAAEAAALLALQPEAANALQVLVEAESIRQETIRATWTVKRATWLIHRGCGSWGDISPPLPSVSWTREPPDYLGPVPLTQDSFSAYYRIEAQHQPRASAAEVFLGNENDETSWHAHWVAPFGLLGANSH